MAKFKVNIRRTIQVYEDATVEVEAENEEAAEAAALLTGAQGEVEWTTDKNDWVDPDSLEVVLPITVMAAEGGAA